ncbi:MAG: glycogen synthase GlgA [Clostridia bacterium]|nr:glycogen synthase GlgA [Clostridia bacterium]
MKILFATSECAPFVKTGGLGDVSAALPPALSALGQEVSVVLPYYGSVKERFSGEVSFITSFYVPLAWRHVYCGIFHTQKDGVDYYFIDNEYYFMRGSVYGDYDDGERYAFFCKACLEMLRYLNYYPDVIHANDWQCAMIPLFYRGFYQRISEYSGIKTMFTIHNMEYQGKVSYDFLKEVLGMDDYYLRYLSFDGCINLMFSAIVLSDKVTTVSETYAEEVKNPYFGHGLDRVLWGVSYKFCGITNGIDTVQFDPKTDENLYRKYSTKSMGGKTVGKKKIQEELGLYQDPDCALMSMVTRLVAHKGLDLVERVLDDIMTRRIQMVILGTGDYRFHERLKSFAARYPDKLSVLLRFDTKMSSKLYAASDLFLMPSKAEPCGLAQMIAMRYGALPIVRKVGGLSDTVFPINPETGEGRGFTFESYNAHDMLNAVDRALDLYYNDRELFRRIAKRNMEEDFSWGRSAARYLAIYESMVANGPEGNWYEIR